MIHRWRDRGLVAVTVAEGRVLKLTYLPSKLDDLDAGLEQQMLVGLQRLLDVAPYRSDPEPGLVVDWESRVGQCLEDLVI
jgi:hypothetical protein